MNSRELTLISTATLFGAVASAIALRLFINPNKKKFPAVDLASNGVPERKSSSLDPFNPSKRSGYLSWDDYFMAIAFLSAERSKDPNRQVGACLVSEDGTCQALATMDFHVVVLMTSFHGQKNPSLGIHYPYVCHAEVNAILNTNHASATGPRLYVTIFPCNECVKIVIQVRGHQPRMNQILLKFEET